MKMTYDKITITKEELKQAFTNYETFKAYIKTKFGIDIDYLEYQEEINEVYNDENDLR